MQVYSGCGTRNPSITLRQAQHENITTACCKRVSSRPGRDSQKVDNIPAIPGAARGASYRVEWLVAAGRSVSRRHRHRRRRLALRQWPTLDTADRRG